MSGATQESIERVIEASTRTARCWRGLAMRLHEKPEIGLKEHDAAQWLCEQLETEGFEIQREVAELPTAFVATRGSSGAPLCVGFLAEYDALPELGHACGHNLIAGVAGLAAVCCAEAAPDRARVLVVGCPAEESYGGKVQLVDKGVFESVDFALMAHGHRMYLPSRRASGRRSLVLEFHGRPAHAAAAPSYGINALDAMIQTFNAVAALRQQLPDEARVHGIITHGGTAANIIPDYTRAEMFVRSHDLEYLDQLEQRVRACARGAAEATGCTLEVSSMALPMQPVRHNPTLEQRYEHNVKLLGQTVGDLPAEEGIGSTDFGNVSQVIPALHAYFKVADDVQLHTRQFAEAAATDAALDHMVVAAQALALTALDIIEDGDLATQARQDFQRGG